MVKRLLLTVALLVCTQAHATPPHTTVDTILTRAHWAVGYSYFWGGACWTEAGDDVGQCTATAGGGCPSCTHTGLGADCSGLINKAWQVPRAEGTNDSCDHGGHSTVDYTCSESGWHHEVRDDVTAGDVLSHNACAGGSGGHVVLVDHGDPWGQLAVVEARGCAYGVTFSSRPFGSNYLASRRVNLDVTTTSPPPAQDPADAGVAAPEPDTGPPTDVATDGDLPDTPPATDPAVTTSPTVKALPKSVVGGCTQANADAPAALTVLLLACALHRRRASA